MNTTENNKKLAEFLEWKQYPIAGKNNGYKVVLKEGFAPIKTSAGHLQFHNDWSWLMKVAEKIEETETKDGRTFTIDMYRDSVIINQYGKYNNEIIVSEGGTRIENLYKACIEFVEWFNNNDE